MKIQLPESFVRKRKVQLKKTKIVRRLISSNVNISLRPSRRQEKLLSFFLFYNQINLNAQSLVRSNKLQDFGKCWMWTEAMEMQF